MRLDTRGEYPPTWKEIATEVKRAAESRCIRCRHPFNTDGVPQLCDDQCDAHRGFHRQRGFAVAGDKRRTGINFTVHHLDGDKGNCRWWNLLALCNSCHLSIQARVIPDRPWLFDHSAWFLDYVCGFYAFHYAEMEITREDAHARADEWLALAQPWRQSTIGVDKSVDKSEVSG